MIQNHAKVVRFPRVPFAFSPVYLLDVHVCMAKDAVIAVRLSEEELKKLDIHAQGQMSRSQIVRILIHDFLGKSEEDQRGFLVNRLFEM
jgi:hypothetical protein